MTYAELESIEELYTADAHYELIEALLEPFAKVYGI